MRYARPSKRLISRMVFIPKTRTQTERCLARTGTFFAPDQHDPLLQGSPKPCWYTTFDPLCFPNSPRNAFPLPLANPTTQTQLYVRLSRVNPNKVYVHTLTVTPLLINTINRTHATYRARIVSNS